MSNDFRFSIASVPSRVVSVAALMSMGVEFPPIPTNPYTTLTEVRPEVGKSDDDNPERLFVATAETEDDVYQVRFTASTEWFVEQIPMSILLNIPDDASSITPKKRRMTRVDHLRAVADGLAASWESGGRPRVKTREFIDNVLHLNPALEDLTQPITPFVAKGVTGGVSKETRALIVTALHALRRRIENPNDTGNTK